MPWMRLHSRRMALAEAEVVRSQPTKEGFSNSEVNRLYSGFKRFMIPGTIDVHKDVPCLTRMKLPSGCCEAIDGTGHNKQYSRKPEARWLQWPA